MKKQTVTILIIALLVLLFMMNGMPTSYYDEPLQASTQERPRLSRQLVVDTLNSNPSGQPLFVKHILNRMLDLNDAQFEKMDKVGLLLKKSLGESSVQASTVLVMFKLVLTGDISGFVNSFSGTETSIDQFTITEKARKFLVRDIVTYRKIIDLILKDPLLTLKQETPEAEKISTEIIDGLTILSKLTDRQLDTFSFMVEYGIENVEVLTKNSSNDEMEDQVNSKIDIIHSPRFPEFLDYLSDKREKGVNIFNKKFADDTVNTFFVQSSSSSSSSLSSFLTSTLTSTLSPSPVPVPVPATSSEEISSEETSSSSYSSSFKTKRIIALVLVILFIVGVIGFAVYIRSRPP